MVVQHNMSAMNASRQLGVTTGKLSKSTEKLSSGYRINRAADDAAGLAISEKMRGQIKGLGQASMNSEDGISLAQTAEGALQESQNIIQRMRELAVQASNDTNTDDDRTQIQNEINQLTNEVDRIATSSEFNTKKLLDGSLEGAHKYKAGNSTVEGTFANGNVGIIGFTASNLVGVDDVIRITLQEDVGKNGNLTFGKLSASTTTATLETLNGLSATNTITFQNGIITIANATYADTDAKKDDTLTGNITIKISNASSLKAGDVITISLRKMVTVEKANPGKESLRLQIGANAGQEMELNISNMKAKALGIVKTSSTVEADGRTNVNAGKALDVTTQSKASLAIQAYDKALERISTERANIGAVQNRLEHTIANLDTSEENLQAAESRIRDVDMAEEMAEYSKGNILMQAGQSMLAQANQSTQGVLSLLQG